MSGQVIQIIEDEPLHAQLLDRAMRHAGFSTVLAADGHSGWNDVQRLQPSLILLDLMLPGMSGQEICRLVRRTPATKRIPIIMLTAVGTEEDRIAGLEMGADDYVVKPFSPREMVSRVQAVLRRTKDDLPEMDSHSDVSVTVQGTFFLVSLQGRQLMVSHRELTFLRFLLTRAGELVTAEELIALSGTELQRIPSEEVEQSIRFLRRKLENSCAGSIELLPRFRYRFMPRG